MGEPKTNQISMLTALRKIKQIVGPDLSIKVSKERWYYSTNEAIMPTICNVSIIPLDGECTLVNGNNFESCIEQIEKLFS